MRHVLQLRFKTLKAFEQIIEVFWHLIAYAVGRNVSGLLPITPTTLDLQQPVM
jgi:hypothetical protein